MKIDDINIEIIKELKDGRKSFKSIADKLNITENTVRTRVAKLKEEKILDICGLFDPSALQGYTTVIIGIKLSEMNLVEKGEEISKLRGVINTTVVTGRYDLIVLVLFNSEFGLLEFYTDEISKVKGIRSVETFVVYKAYNLMVPYVL
ncbi:MAG: Lrp/AsnC family transcriptional regulator [Desulfamplus sp.]|nr:Lrp/AsnC family transcriptional regulator [Desulfamplus sp.]MBF0241823.1 Lrp/AsnC family transcriptional regulator [Desulfamplus sp.]MBF0390674.1 Lrp/AsnC family transcriptional regulator [Desulfamplus sp.]